VDPSGEDDALHSRRGANVGSFALPIQVYAPTAPDVASKVSLAQSHVQARVTNIGPGRRPARPTLLPPAPILRLSAPCHQTLLEHRAASRSPAEPRGLTLAFKEMLVRASVEGLPLQALRCGAPLSAEKNRRLGRGSQYSAES